MRNAWRRVTRYLVAIIYLLCRTRGQLKVPHATTGSLPWLARGEPPAFSPGQVGNRFVKRYATIRMSDLSTISLLADETLQLILRPILHLLDRLPALQLGQHGRQCAAIGDLHRHLG